MPWQTLALAGAALLAAYIAAALVFRRLAPGTGRVKGALGAAHRRAFPDAAPAAGFRATRLGRFLGERLDPHLFRGLPLTLLVAAALYAVLLFGDLTEDVRELGALDHFDQAIGGLVAPWRVEPALTLFRWISAIAAGPAILAVLMVGSGLLLARPGLPAVAALWLAFAGAQLTTTLGKVMVGRPRPQPMYEPAALSAFPSGHATVVMAVYGLFGYVIARDLPGGGMARFNVAFATAVLILLVGLSRVVLNVHFPSDVAGGYLVGLFWLLAGVIVAEWRRPAAGGGSGGGAR